MPATSIITLSCSSVVSDTKWSIMAELEELKTLDRPIAHGVIAGCLLTLAPARLEPATVTVRAGTKEEPGPKGPGLRTSTYFELRT